MRERVGKRTDFQPFSPPPKPRRVKKEPTGWAPKKKFDSKHNGNLAGADSLRDHRYANGGCFGDPHTGISAFF